MKFFLNLYNFSHRLFALYFNIIWLHKALAVVSKHTMSYNGIISQFLTEQQTETVFAYTLFRITLKRNNNIFYSYDKNTHYHKPAAFQFTIKHECNLNELEQFSISYHNMKITIILALTLVAVCVMQVRSIPKDSENRVLQKELQRSLIQDAKEHVRPRRQSCIERCNSLCSKKGFKGVCVKGLCRCT